VKIVATIAGFAVAAAAAISLPAYASSVNLVTNGDFSSSTVTGASPLIVNSGTGTVATGWTTTSTYSFLLTASQATSGFYNGSSGNISLYSATASPAGGNFVVQDGNYLTGTLSQSISGLTVGHVYALSFYQALGQQTGYTGMTTNQWVVSLGGQTDYSTQLTNASGGFTGWSYVTDYFTATATTETLGFTTSATGAPPFALLDGISMVDTPEPASWTVMLVGLMGLAGVRRRAQARR
jgi:hypothetical protein